MGWLDLEEGGHAFAAVDSADGFAKEVGDAEGGDFVAFGHGDGIGADEAFDRAFSEALDGHFVEDGVGDGGVDAAGSALLEEAG